MQMWLTKVLQKIKEAKILGLEMHCPNSGLRES